MSAPCLALRSVRLEFRDWNTHGNARPAVVAVRTVGKRAAAAKSQPHQVTVNAAVDQVAWRRDLRPCQAVREVTARIRRGRIELQRRQRKVVELGHGGSAWAGGVRFQGSAGCVEFTNRATSSANSRRGIGRAPKRARCSVCCWQSIIGIARRLSSSIK